jgi:arylsulfatase
VSCNEVDVDQKSEDNNQVAVDQKVSGGNAIPYPLEEWKGVQGKTLADSKPHFIGQKKRPRVLPM